jgi:hypothetical protein
MSNNPSSTLTRPKLVVDFCLSRHERDGETLICTRVNTHPGHCCDEVMGGSWTDRGAKYVCRKSHSAEKSQV